jgi:chromosome segregation ATPase
VFDSLQSQLGKLLGKREDDPQQTITADQLKVVLKSIEGKYNNLKNENKLYKSKIEEQKNSVAELERAVSELKGGAATGLVADAGLLTQLEADLDAARNQLSDNQELVASLRAEKLQLQSKLSVQEALVSSLRHEMSELREGHAGAASPEDHAKALTKVDKLEFDNQQLQEKVQDISKRLIEAEAIQPELVKQQQALIAAQQDLAESKQQTETALQSKRQAEVERDGVMARLAPLIDELDTLRDELSNATAERDALKSGVANNSTALSAAKAELDATNEQLQQLQMDKDELKHQTVRQQTDLDNLQEQLASGGPQGQVIEELEGMLVETRGKVEQMQTENTALQERLRELLAEPPGMNTREKTELEFQIKRQTEELREAGLQISSLREAKVKANLDLEEAAAELIELRRQIDDMRRDRNQYRDRLEERRDEQDDMDQMKSQMRELMTEMSRMRGTSQPPPRQTEQPRQSTPRAADALRPRNESPRQEPQRQDAPRQPEAGKPAVAGEANITGASLARRREMLNRLIGEKKEP